MYPEPYPTQTYAYPGGGIDTGYPGALPPPVQYPKRTGRPWLIAGAAVLAVVAVVAVLIAVAFGGGRDEQTSTNALTDASAKAAIQDYLDALTDGDAETVARHTLCGLFDAVKERRSDMALARLSSDAFRKQYESAEVTAIDKMVQSSPTQAQVLFTMRVIPASGSSRNQPDEAEEQAVAQLLSIDDEVLVCSYLPRTAGQY
jgi:ketosteroid isomerase-like protein